MNEKPSTSKTDEVLLKLRQFASTIVNFVDETRKSKKDPTFHVRIDVEKPVVDEPSQLQSTFPTERRSSFDTTTSAVANPSPSVPSSSNVALKKKAAKKSLIHGKAVFKSRTRNQGKHESQQNQSLKIHKQGFPAVKLDLSKFERCKKRTTPQTCKECLEKGDKLEKDPRWDNDRYIHLLHFRCLGCFNPIKTDGIRENVPLKQNSQVDTIKSAGRALQHTDTLPFVQDTDYRMRQSSSEKQTNASPVPHASSGKAVSSKDTDYRMMKHSFEEQRSVSPLLYAGSKAVDTSKDSEMLSELDASLAASSSKSAFNHSPGITSGTSGASLSNASRIPRDPRVKAKAQSSEQNLKDSMRNNSEDDNYKLRQLDLMRRLIKSPIKKKHTSAMRTSKSFSNSFSRRKPPSDSSDSKSLNKSIGVRKKLPTFSSPKKSPSKRLPNTAFNSNETAAVKSSEDVVSVKQETLPSTATYACSDIEQAAPLVKNEPQQNSSVDVAVNLPACPAVDSTEECEMPILRTAVLASRSEIENSFFEDGIPQLNISPLKKKRFEKRLQKVKVFKDTKKESSTTSSEQDAITESDSISPKRQRLDNEKERNVDISASLVAECVAISPKSRKLDQETVKDISASLVAESDTVSPKKQKLDGQAVKDLDINASLAADIPLKSSRCKVELIPLPEAPSILPNSELDEPCSSKAELDSPTSPIIISDSDEEKSLKSNSPLQVLDFSPPSNHEPANLSQPFNTPPRSPKDEHCFLHNDELYCWPISSPSAEEIQAMSDDVESEPEFSDTIKNIQIHITPLLESGYIPKCFIKNLRDHQCCTCCNLYCCKSSWMKVSASNW